MKLLLHACCAPCSSYVVEFLKPYYEITLFFSNDNIMPHEYEKRRDEMVRFAKLVNVPLIIDEYDPNRFHKAVKGYERLREGSLRCHRCYAFRIKRTFERAKRDGFDLVSTTLSISPYKNPKWINEIGIGLISKYHIAWLESNFYENHGYERSLELCEEYGLYQQDYCGCAYSYSETHGGKNNESANNGNE